MRRASGWRKSWASRSPTGRCSIRTRNWNTTTPKGAPGRCNIEVATGHYRAGEIAAKAAAGFQMHGNGPRAARAIGRALGRDRDSGRRGGGVGRDPASIEL